MIKLQKVACAALFVGLVYAATACSDGLTDINSNPNGPTTVPVQYMLPQALQASVSNAFGTGQMLQHSGVWSQHYCQLQYPDEETGNVRASRMDGYWSGWYTGALKDIQTVIDIGVEAEHVNAQGVGRIWKSWAFSIMTDFWGDLPYSQALQGEDPDLTAPAYDSQSDIYAGLTDELTAGAALLSNAAQDFGAGDLIYGNDMDAWRRFANSLRMRLAMRLSNVDATRAAAAFVAANNAGPLTSNADNAMLAWPGAPYENPFYENYLGRDDNGISKTMVDQLMALNDPRIALYAEPATDDGVYRGHENGRDDLPDGLSLASFSRIGNFWRRDGAATPTAIMTYSEVLFLQAEAAARGWIAGDPGALYTAAITANMNQYDDQGVGPTDAEITAYLAQPEIAYTDINDIHLQKWISLYMNGSEAWAHVRRTNVPVLPIGPDLTWLGTIPVRFSYPSTEQSLNAVNLDAAVARQGGGLGLVTRLWWDTGN